MRLAAWITLAALALPPAASAGGAADLVSRLPFEVGVAHVNGDYAFTDGNFLVEGSRRISELGSRAIFLYLTNNYATQYPDKGSGLFGTPHNLAELAASPAYRQVFAMPFDEIVLTTFTFANADAIFRSMQPTEAVAAREREEIYQLAKYLYATYRGSHKVFILKNWESDWFGLRGYDASGPISASAIEDLINWLRARQEGVAQARREAGDPDDVAVLNAVEVNRPLDWVEKGLTRVLNAVVPAVGPDMVSYSSYDATAIEALPTMRREFEAALAAEDRIAPDPLHLGRKRIFVSEFAPYENRYSPQAGVEHIAAILDTARGWGVSGAFLWELYDNECTPAPGKARLKVAAAANDPERPKGEQCPGNWIVRPDGGLSRATEVLRKYWNAPK